MSPPVLQLPLDLSGNAVTKKVTAELHTVAATGTRAFVTTRGPFYTRNFVLRNDETGTPLVPDVDYRPVHMLLEASLRCGQEICSVALILPACTATSISVDYQAIGGEYSVSVSAIEQMLEGLDLDNRTIHWGDLLGVPEYFPPTAHLHDVGDVYGFEYVVNALLEIERAILLGDQAAFDELRAYIDSQDAAIRAMITGFDSLINDHINNTNNPHQTTKAHVGLSNVDNYATASLAEAQAGIANNRFMTPLRTAQAINALVGDLISAHVSRTDNPHNTTKSQIGLGNVDNFATATTAEAQAGTATNLFMTPATTLALISVMAGGSINAHIARTDNPHQTTKAHVGLGNVSNYATASIADGQAGTATNLFMTPAATRAAILAIGGSGVGEAHLTDFSNPHNVNKIQVGLQLVQNYAAATYTTIMTGNETNLYMTPSATKALFMQLGGGGGGVGEAHLTDYNNPHHVTAAQIGLGSLGNYAMASQAEAQTGTSNVLYMSPLRTKQAVQYYAIDPLTALINQRVVIDSTASLMALYLGSTSNSARPLLYQDNGSTEVTDSFVVRSGGASAPKYFAMRKNGDFYVHNGRVVASGGFQPSDRRLKKHVKKAEARSLWREFDFKEWNLRQTGEHQKGVIAQELQEAAPDRVYEYAYGPSKKGETRLSVDYAGAAFEMAYAAGKEIDELKSLVAKLTARLADLESRP